MSTLPNHPDPRAALEAAPAYVDSAVRESIGYRRTDAFPGIEIIDASNTGRSWSYFNALYGLAMMRSWHGEVLYRGRAHRVIPGQMFCPEPGETHTALPDAGSAGSFDVFMIASEVLTEHLAEHGMVSQAPHWKEVVHASSQNLAAKFDAVLGVVHSASGRMQVQSSISELIGALASEMISGARPRIESDPKSRVAARIRECLHYEGTAMDLNELAKKVGLSRFQTLRIFKRRYGLPPHAYQLCLRISMAQQRLLAGDAPARVAAETGFVDQSHMIRHFKRLAGVTPRRYLAGAAVERVNRSDR